MCGILGIVSKTNDTPIKIYEGLTYLQHRGQDSAGICNENECIKKNGLVKDAFNESELQSLFSNLGMGQVRYGTNGSFKNTCIQPLIIEKAKNRISLVHNGNIKNTNFLREKLQISESREIGDSELILELFSNELLKYENYNYNNIFDIISKMMKLLEGSYCVIIIIKDYGLITFRDIYGIRPLIFGKKENDYIISSESVVLDILEYQTIRDINPGEMIIFEKNELPRFYQYNKSSLYPCLFEYMYFARIDSVIDNISIYNARFETGKLLGEKIKKQINEKDIDMIVPVPDTSYIFALGLQETLQKKIQNGFVKNSYIDRTFIMKDNKIINKNIRRKINAVKSVLEGKNILIVDDSIVRGNTSSHLIFLAKKAGAKNIYLASGSPQVLHPNNYGIYIPDREHLIAVNRSNQEIADVIGATKVIYNDLYEIVNCLKRLNPKIDGFEVSMFNGKKIEEINK